MRTEAAFRGTLLAFYLLAAHPESQSAWGLELMGQGLRSAIATRALVVFPVGDTYYGAPAEEVAGLMEAEFLAPLPGRMAPVAGVVAFRGGVVPVLDLARALGVEVSPGRSRYAVVMERGTDRFALLVCGMPRLVNSSDLEERRMPASGAEPKIDHHSPAEEKDAPAWPLPPKILAVYGLQGSDVRTIDYWALMDSIAPPAAFRLSGLGDR